MRVRLSKYQIIEDINGRLGDWLSIETENALKRLTVADLIRFRTELAFAKRVTGDADAPEEEEGLPELTDLAGINLDIVGDMSSEEFLAATRLAHPFPDKEE